MIAMVIALIVLMVIGMPIGFSLLLGSLAYFISSGASLNIIVQKMTMTVGDSFSMMAVPFFMFAGAVMNNSGITEQIFGFADKLVGHIRGGMGHANILASVIFAGMSGSAIADTGGLGAIELKAMKDAGYDDDFSLAITGASSCIGPVIPPSVPFVMYGVIAGVSIGSLFMAGVVPGLCMAFAMAVVVWYQAKKRGYEPHKRATLREICHSFTGSFWGLLAPVILIGGIVTGVCTPTEAAVVAAVYSLIISFITKSIKISDLPALIDDTVKTTAMVMLIASASCVFGWILTVEQIPVHAAAAISAIVPNKVIAILLVNFLFLVVGMFMDGTASIIILTPILVPLMSAYGMNLVHFGVLMTVNVMIGLLTPPVGMVLYVLSGVSGEKVERISKAMIPYIITLIIVVLVLSFVPGLVLFLPKLLGAM
ncbi:MAG: TRAP transporter large permease [Clostridium sp.]